LKGLSYDAARKRIIAAGWKPRATKSNSANAEDTEAMVKLFRTRGYMEVEYCAPTGLAACVFNFVDKVGNRLAVRTAGEELPERAAHAVVTGFDLSCCSE
jgi:hypothetical protein